MENEKLLIRNAGNTLIPALLSVEAKGYELALWYTCDGDGGLNPQYDAEKDGRRFSATSPVELLGLIAIWEVRGDDWRLKAGESRIHDRLIDESLVYDHEGNVIDVD